jgi:hypothetical protein
MKRIKYPKHCFSNHCSVIRKSAIFDVMYHRQSPLETVYIAVACEQHGNMQGRLGFEEGYCSLASTNVSEEYFAFIFGVQDRKSKKPA